MSILPYGEASVFGWSGAFGLSVTLHGLMAFGVLGGMADWLAAAPEPPESAPFLISFAPLETPQVEPLSLPPDPADPVPETPAGLMPETLAPVTSEAETLAPISPEVLQGDVVNALVETAEPRPILPSDSATGGTTAETGAGSAPAPAASSAETATATEQDLELAAWIDRIRASTAPPCLAALLRREGETGVGLALVAADQAAMADYADRLLDGAPGQPTISRVLIDPRQCAVLDFLRAHADYPATGLGLTIEAPTVVSGGRMTGFVRGAAGRQLTLLLVDDNGVVQVLNRFLSFSGNLARFEVPVTRAGEARATGQIVIALATRGQPAELAARAGRLADDVFPGLPRDLSDSALLALATVEIR